jgi:hypothetical protein
MGTDVIATTVRESGATPSASITAALLAPTDRIPREPLAPWATRLLDALGRATATIRTACHLADKLGHIGNNVGLIAAQRGDTQRAWSVTQRQFWWHGRLARRSSNAAITAYAIQPWVNLGRMEALSGRPQEALARFAGLSAFEVANRLEMGCMRVVGSDWSAIAASRGEFVQFLDAVYVIDSLKAILLNHCFELVHPFMASGGAKGTLRWMCDEACVVADTRMGDYRAAISRAGTAAREATRWNRAVLRLRLAEAHACAGEVDRAREILSQIAGVVRQVSPEVKAKPELLPITARLAGACHEAGLADDACAVARDVLQGARTANDEMIQIEMLKLLAAAASEDEAKAWRDAADAAVEATDYARFRRGKPPRANPVFDELYERLEAIYT